MAELPPWVGALKISAQDYQQWIADLPAPEFVLAWAIETGKIDEAAYLKWAMGCYQLPLVSPDFLKKAPPIEMWKKYADGPWNPTALPLYEWQGTLVVGVLEPKNFALENVTLQYVLAPLSTQQPWWRLFAKVKQEALIGKKVGTPVSSMPPVAPPNTPSFPEVSRIVPPKAENTVTSSLPGLGSMKLKMKGAETPPPPPAEAAEAVGENGARVLKFPSAPSAPSAPAAAATPPPIPSVKLPEASLEEMMKQAADKQDEAAKPAPVEVKKSDPDEKMAGGPVPTAADMEKTISGLPPLGGNTGALHIKKVS